MNYIKELNAFRDWAVINRPSTGQVALWYTLISICNMTGWQEWFTVPNQTLQLMTGLSRQGLEKARNQLIQRGLIEYRKGTSNQAGRYRIIPFEKQKVDCQKVGTEVGTMVGTEVGTVGAFQEAQEERSSCTLYKQNKTKNINLVTSNEVTADADDAPPTNQQLITELTKEYRKLIPQDKHQKGDFSFIGRLYNEYGYDKVLLAINELGYRIDSGFIPEKPLIYLNAILKGDGKSGGRGKKSAANDYSWYFD
ncbi:hypothetical protein [Carboxydothermus pertinax]|uniref:DnaD domain-containing protein n=1 Tax=Carboxydothermus pertinax TaxID=870242 RepID=A0A1L8CRU2_9THEO|nr:hypothetical protein [Carboxydothermus pertinax]GAV21584.1 hypothetical protein cpu_00940 [Carboxydothermus pertinax]